MLSHFLRETSIHGLRYVVEARLPLVRLVWLLCFVTCLTLAAVIIQLNVQAWKNSPAAITSVEPALVKGVDLMPMVTVCPRTFSYANMLQGLLQSDPDLVRQDDVDAVASAVVEVELTRRQQERILSSQFVTADWRFHVYDNCRQTNNSEEGCSLPRLLFRIANTGDEFGNEGIVTRYLVQKFLSGGSPLDLASLEAHAAAEKGVEALDDYAGEDAPQLKWDLLDLYAYFFPLADGDELAPLRDIKEYSHQGLPAVNRTNFASLLGFFIDWQVFSSDRFPKPAGYNSLTIHETISEVITSSLLHAVAAFFDFSDEEDPSVLYHVLNDFAYNDGRAGVYTGFSRGDERALFRLGDSDTHPCDVADDSFAIVNASTVCSAPNASSECLAYCRLVRDETVQEKVVALLRMASPGVGPVVGSRSRSLLPACLRFGKPHFGEECWQTVVTEKGICHSALRGKEARTVEEVGQSHSFDFALDMSGDIADPGRFEGDGEQLVQFWHDTSADVLTGPAHHYTVDQFTVEESIKTEYNKFSRHQARRIELAARVTYMTETTDEFHDMSPKRRNCYFADEHKLRMYPYYSMPNCKLECAFEQGAQECGCVPWFIKGYFADRPLCQTDTADCFARILSQRNEKDVSSCSRTCMPDCTKVDYTIQEFENPFFEDLPTEFDDIFKNKTSLANADPNVGKALELLEPLDDVVGMIKVYVSHKSTMSYIRTATATLVDMISNIGGTLGLFCGFSILSAVEIFYWAGSAMCRKAL